MERPTRGEIIMVACGAVLFVTSFLELWGRYECSTCPAEARVSKVSLWSGGSPGQAPFSIVTRFAIVLVAVVLVIVALRLFGLSLPWDAGRIYVGVGSMVTLLLIISLIAGPSDLGFGHTELLEVTRGPMLWIGWLLGLGMLFGALRHMGETAAARRPPPGPVVLR